MADSDSLSASEFELEEEEAAAADGSEAGLEELECAVCTDSLWDPIRLTNCGHAFCRACLLEVVRRGAAHEGGGQRCPLCRADFPIRTADTVPLWLVDTAADATLVQRLLDRFPAIYERRKAEAELRAKNTVRLRVVDSNEGAIGQLDTPWWKRIAIEVLIPPGYESADPRRVAEMIVDEVRFEACSSEDVEQAVQEASRRKFIEASSSSPMHEKCVEDGDTIHVMHQPPFDISFEAEQWNSISAAAGQENVPGGDDGALWHLPIRISFKRRLAMPDHLFISHPIRPPPASSSSSSAAAEGTTTTVRLYELPLPEGLTWARLFERTRPKARIGVGSSSQIDVYG